MKSKTITSTFIKSLILALILLLAGQASHLPAGAAGGEDDGLLVGGFGEGFGPIGSGTVELEFGATYRGMAADSSGRILLVGEKQDNFWLARFSTDGTLDRGFGENGQVSTGLLGLDQALDVAIQPDGKIAAVGVSNDDFAAVRYESDGKPDMSFGEKGIVTLDFVGGRDVARAVAIRPDGKIVLAGSSVDISLSDFALARLNPDGTPDLSFDGDAKHAFNIRLNHAERFNTLVLEPDGRIVAIGGSDFDDGFHLAIARFLPNGRFDNTLDGDGKFSSDLIAPSFNEAVQLDGKIIIAHTLKTDLASRAELVRFHFNGERDFIFGIGGVAKIPPGLTEKTIRTTHVLRLPDGNLLFAGNTDPKGDLVVASFTPEGRPNPAFGNGLGYVTLLSRGDNESVLRLDVTRDGYILLLHKGDDDIYLTRLHPNGRPDRGGGRVFTNYANHNDILRDVTLQPDGKIVVTGEVTERQGNKLNPRLTVARYTTAGQLDKSFNFSGIIRDFYGFRSVGRAVALDARSRILVAGQVRPASTGNNFDFTLRRYEPDGREARFPAVPDGLWPVTDLSGSYDDVVGMAVQPDGKIVLAGYAGFKTPPADFALVRYLDDGRPDPAFGNGGIVLTDFDGQGSIDFAIALVLQPDGKLLLAGHSISQIGQGGMVLLRYLPDGTPDPAFGGGDGKATVAFSIASLALLPDGKILTGGTGQVNGGHRFFVVARYTASGELDTTFNGSGSTLAGFVPEVVGTDLIVEPDGAIVMTGCTIERVDRFALARFLPDGQPDNSFSGDGKALFDMNSVENACANALARDPANGDYLLAGSADLGLVDAQFALARVKGRGQINPIPGPGSFSVFLPVVVK